MKFKLLALVLLLIHNVVFAEEDALETEMDLIAYKFVKQVQWSDSSSADFQDFGESSGISFSLLLHFGDGAFRKLSPEDSRVKVHRKRDGKVVSVPMLLGTNDYEYIITPHPSDGSYIIDVNINTDRLKTLDSHFEIHGQIAAILPDEEDVLYSRKIPMQIGAKISLGDDQFNFIVAGVQIPRDSDSAVTLTLRSEGEQRDLTDINFLDADLENIESIKGGIVGYTYGDKNIKNRLYTLNRRPDEFVLAVAHLTRSKLVYIPFVLSSKQSVVGK